MKKSQLFCASVLSLLVLSSWTAWAGVPSPTPTAAIPLLTPTCTCTPLIISGDPPAPSPMATPASTVGSAAPVAPLPQAAPEKRLALKPGSCLWLSGSTTKETYQLSARALLGSVVLNSPLPPSLGESSLLSAVTQGGVQEMRLVVPVGDLGSGDKRLDGNAFHALRGGEDPYIQFQLEEETLAKNPAEGAYLLKGSGQLTVAGVTRNIAIEGKTVFSKNQVRMTGVQEIRLGDFHIKPLSAFWGAMHEEDVVDIHFDLLFGAE